MPYLEIKTRKYIDATLAQYIIDKRTVIGINSWLLQSDFAEIGVTRPQKITIDGDEIVIDEIDLNKGKISNRRRLREFLVEVMAQEVNAMFIRLGETPSKKEYQEATYTLRKLQQLKMSIEDEAYQFLQKAS